MHSEFRSVAEYLRAVENEVARAKQSARSKRSMPSPVSDDDYDVTMAYGVGMYELWKSEWSREKPFEAALRMSLENKARMYAKLGTKRLHPAEAHLFELFGIDWTPEAQSSAAHKVRPSGTHGVRIGSKSKSV